MWMAHVCALVLHLLYYLSQSSESQALTVNVQQSSEWGYLAGRTKQLDKLSDYDITIPYRLEGRQRRSTPTLTEDGHLKEATFVLEVNGDELIIDLKLNVDLFPAKYIQRSYLPDGQLLTKKPHKLHHCYYHGEVRNSNSSVVALSTCNGLSGLIILDGKTLYVEPLSDSEYEHLIYTPDNVKRKKKTWVYDSGLFYEQGTNGETEAMHQHARVRRDVFEETKYVELFIVADNTEYMKQGRDKDLVFARCKEMANTMDLIYRPLKMRIALIGVEVWNEGDQFTVSTNPTTTMKSFHRWRKEFLLPVMYNDNAQFVTGKSFDGSTVGMASLNVMCSLDRSGGVNEDHGVNAADVASTMTHEMGHNMGFVHDTEDCVCDAPSSTGCVMEPSSGSTPPTIFSSCSEADLNAALLRGLGACLFNYPKAIFQGPHCGNGFLEKGEECDCGTVEDCNNVCCDPEKCTLVANATCANGECCEDCQLKEPGVQCREEVNKCDLPEYCTGIHNECPGNVYRQNGEACSNMAKDAICYNGQCVTYDDQCISLWGEGARKAHNVCYNFNKQGTDFGNCGVDDTAGDSTFTPCSSKDILCGKLMCDGGADFPIIGVIARASVGYQYDAQLTRHTCKSASIDLGEDIPDPGYVTEGSLCGTSSNQFCVETRCQNKSDLNIRDCPYNCYNHGVCNSNNHCHCDPQWAPPLCKSEGYGGSIDSGPARPQGDAPTVPSLTTSDNLLPDFTDRNKEVQAHNSTIITLLVVFLVVVPLLVIGGIAAYIKRRQLQQIIGNKRFTHVPKDTSKKADVTNGHPTSNQISRPDIVMNTSSATKDTSIIYKPKIESGSNRPPKMPPLTKPAEPSQRYITVVRQDSSTRKPIKPPPPVPEATSSMTAQPSPVRKAPTKPPQAVTSPPPLPPTAPIKPPAAAMKPPAAAMKPPAAAMKPPAAAMKPPTAPPRPPEAASEQSRPSVAMRPPASRPPPVPKPKFNANNSAESSVPSTTPTKYGAQTKPPRRPVPAPRPESLRIKNFAVPKQRPPIPRRPASTSGDPSV